uniref:Uncharacterized protein n=1 Tax=Knipowitschia caucasica TaxID=637954 RepID=A0AAV2LA28_KNICA
MGNCFCCHSKGPCDSAEETSLLQNDSKAAVAPAETPGAVSVGGTCGPGLEEDISKEQFKDATEIYSTQENGTLQKNKASTKSEKEEVEQPSSEPAAPHSQVFPISAITEEVVNTDPSHSVDKDDPEHRSGPAALLEAHAAETQSHIPECSVGLVCSAPELSDEGESSPAPHATAAADESHSLQQAEMCGAESLLEDTPETTAENTETVKAKDEPPGEDCEEKHAALKNTECASPETVAKEEMVLSSSDSSPTASKETPAAVNVQDEEEDLEDSEEDLYRGAEELSAELTTEAVAPSLSESLSKLEDRCSLAPAVDIMSYSEREWRGNTAKSALIRKGYKELSQKFSSLRRVRGDNYCALRATLYQVLCNTSQMPQWLREDNITTLPKELEAQDGLICQWIFPGECLRGDGTGDATLQLQSYLELLQKKWREAAACASAAERQQLCEQWFQGGEEELALLEALKLLMLSRAVELHCSMHKGDDTPLFCWLLFARDSSDSPRSFLANHLSHVGLSAGLEQVEMFLLGYALQCTIQVYRLYKADTEEFVTFYPDDHKEDWPCVCLVTEDDRHYNVPVCEAAALPQEAQCS